MAVRAKRDRKLVIGGVDIRPGQRVNIELPVARLHTHTELTMPVRVVRGESSGPTLFVSAAIHGDEINGVEIIRRLLRLKGLGRLRGTLIAVPLVNVFGFIGHTRYLPDRRDLNRSFPGTDHGSLAARLAHLFMTEVVRNSTHGVDLHTGALHRTNLPQVRVRLTPKSESLARVFGTPIVLHANVRDGSLRAAVEELGIPVVLYEGGEALRFDEWAIRAGLQGIVSVMQALDMLPAGPQKKERHTPYFARDSLWIRSHGGGILRVRKSLGARVYEGDLLGVVGDPFGDNEVEVRAPVGGLIIGRTNLPLVNEGDALFHIALLEGDGHGGKRAIRAFRAEYASLPVFDPALDPHDGDPR